MFFIDDLSKEQYKAIVQKDLDAHDAACAEEEAAVKVGVETRSARKKREGGEICKRGDL